MRDRSITNEMAALIKGMLKRGDEQSDIAACFLINGGRISEIHTRQRFADIEPASEEYLPPPPPYASPYELWKAANSLWAVRVTLEGVRDVIEKSLTAVGNAEARAKPK